jgi:prevent-host-death family protein
MKQVTLADANTHLGELVERAISGETVWITRRGKPVACLTGVDRVRAPIDLARLRALTDAMPYQSEPAATWLRTARDESR